MKTRVLNYIKKYNMLSGVEKIVAGISGGADSVCLLFLLCEIISGEEEYKNITLDVVHVNHGIRKEASDDALFVKNLSEKLSQKYHLDIPFHLAEVDVEAMASELGMSTEEMGRIVRYDAMNKVLGDKKGVIAVAHNANDQAETMLFNLFRGSGLKGASGIAPVSGNVIRPLLEVSRKDIEEFINSQQIEYVNDSTNFEDNYTRNKIRHHIIEYATENISKSVVQNMTNASVQLRNAEEYVKESTLKAAMKCTLCKTKDRIEVNLEELLKEHNYIIDRVLYEAVTFVAGRKKDITNSHIEAIKGILDANGSKKVNLPYNILAKKEYGRLAILKSDKIHNLYDSGSLKMKVLEEFDINKIPSQIYTKWFDYDKITSVAVLRTRKEGDYLTVNSSLQKKSLKDYFINEKIPKDMRDSHPLLADDNHIMWVIGKRISEYYKVTDKTKRILEVSYVRED